MLGMSDVGETRPISSEIFHTGERVRVGHGANGLPGLAAGGFASEMQRLTRT